MTGHRTISPRGRFAALQADHPSIGQLCPICHKPMQIGDVPALIATGPGDAEERQRADEDRSHNAAALLAHEACAHRRPTPGDTQRPAVHKPTLDQCAQSDTKEVKTMGGADQRSEQEQFVVLLTLDAYVPTDEEAAFTAAFREHAQQFAQVRGVEAVSFEERTSEDPEDVVVEAVVLIAATAGEEEAVASRIADAFEPTTSLPEALTISDVHACKVMSPTQHLEWTSAMSSTEHLIDKATRPNGA
jgi:hypothetical protein